MTKEFESIILPIYRTSSPRLFTEEICGVQPMSENINSSIKVTYIDKEPEYKFGTLIHNFIYGYQVYDGVEFIDMSLFIVAYGKQQITKWQHHD